MEHPRSEAEALHKGLHIAMQPHVTTIKNSLVELLAGALGNPCQKPPSLLQDLISLGRATVSFFTPSQAFSPWLIQQVVVYRMGTIFVWFLFFDSFPCAQFGSISQKDAPFWTASLDVACFRFADVANRTHAVDRVVGGGSEQIRVGIGDAGGTP